MATIKVYAWYKVKFYKDTPPPKKKFQTGARARRAGAGFSFIHSPPPAKRSATATGCYYKGLARITVATLNIYMWHVKEQCRVYGKMCSSSPVVVTSSNQ